MHPSATYNTVVCNYLSLSSVLQPASNLQTFNEGKRSVSYTFAASPTSGVTYKVTYTPLIAGIPTPQTERFNSACLRTTSGLTPDVTYRLQVFTVKNGMESAAISRDFITLPDGKIIACVVAYIIMYTSERCRMVQLLQIDCYI